MELSCYDFDIIFKCDKDNYWYFLQGTVVLQL